MSVLAIPHGASHVRQAAIGIGDPARPAASVIAEFNFLDSAILLPQNSNKTLTLL